MIEDDVVSVVEVEEVISLFAEQGRSRSKSRTTAEATSRAADPPTELRAGRGVCSTQAEARAADGGVRATRALTCKQLGEIAEAEFVAKAVGMGFVVAKPWGDSNPYDFIVNLRRNFWRVQVKSAHVVGEDGGCSFRAHDGSLKSYTAEDIDALVAYAKPAEAWYVMPVRVVEGLRSLKLYPGSARRRSKYERWREAWEVLRRAVRRTRRWESKSPLLAKDARNGAPGASYEIA